MRIWFGRRRKEALWERGPRRVDDVFGKGMMLGFSERFVFFCFFFV